MLKDYTVNDAVLKMEASAVGVLWDVCFPPSKCLQIHSFKSVFLPVSSFLSCILTTFMLHSD